MRLWRERRFYDQEHARGSPQRCVDSDPHWKPLQFVARYFGAVSGRHLLDVGCGAGELSVLWALKGATVTAVDVSQVALKMTLASARFNGVAQRVSVCLADASHLPFEDGCFDLLFGHAILHHLPLETAAPELVRVLRPRLGLGAFMENSADNPVVLLGRRYLTGRWGFQRRGSNDEYPLTRDELTTLGGYCRVTRHFPDFYMFRLLNLNWVLRGSLWGRVLEVMDQILGSVPGLTSYSYHQVVTLER